MGRRAHVFLAATVAVVALCIGAAARQSPAPERDQGRVTPGAALLQRAQGLVTQMVQREQRLDATCWSTVHLLEGFAAGRQLSPEAELARIEASRALLDTLWARAASRDGSVTAASLERALPRTGLETESQFAQDQGRHSEGARTLLSLMTAELRAPAGRPRLDDVAAWQIAEMSSGITVALLQEAGRLADRAGHDQLQITELQNAYRTLLDRWFGGEAARRPAPTGEPGAAHHALRSLALETVRGKRHALRAYNGLAERATPEKLAQQLSDLLGVSITASVVRSLMLDLREFAARMVAPDLPFRSDTFGDTLAGAAVSHNSPDARWVQVEHIFNAVQNLFPSRRYPNGDVEVSMLRNIAPREGGQSRMDERRLRMFGPTLDGVRDTGLHWAVVEALLREDTRLALGPFATELLSEVISEYATFVLKGAVTLAARVEAPEVDRRVYQHNTWKYPRGRFFPPEQAESAKRAPEAPLPPPVAPRFRRRHVTEAGWSEACTRGRDGFQGFMGSGIALGDLDQDGLPDLFVAADGCNRLLRNRGGYRFDDVTEQWGLPAQLSPTSRHPLFADVDGDGALDLLVIDSGRPSRLFMQRQGGFVDETSRFGLRTGAGAHVAHFFDFDRDGDLDLHVGHYGPSRGDSATPSLDGRNGHPNQLWRNEGGARFVNVSEASGMDSRAWTLASAALDVDGDGWQDLWLANDFGPDQVFRNLGDGRFHDVAPALGSDDRGSGMGVSLADLDRDGRSEVFVSMIEMFTRTLRFVLPKPETVYSVGDRVLKASYYISGNKLFATDEGGGLKDETLRMMDSRHKGWAWGAAFFDLENDGDQDLYLANGWIERSAFWQQRNQLMVHAQGMLRSAGPPIDGPADEEHFAEAYLGSSRSVVAADLTGRGRADLLVLDYHGGLSVLENRVPALGGALRVQLQGRGRNTRGIGARVRVFTDQGALPSQVALAGGGYLAQGELPMRFGLGAATQATHIEVRWPSGSRTMHPGPFLADTEISLEE